MNSNDHLIAFYPKLMLIVMLRKEYDRLCINDILFEKKLKLQKYLAINSAISTILLIIYLIVS
jgi:hypothetical protein